MASRLFSDIINSRQERSRYSDYEMRDWLRYQAEKASPQKPKTFIENAKEAQVSDVKIGKLYMYGYDPKHKKTLPYYDVFPATFPIQFYNDGFLGMNMHYLPNLYRARLMDALYDVLNNDNFNENTKLNASYKILKNASKFRYFRPTIHRYLSNHVRSRFIEIHPKEWDYCLFLPWINGFKKASERKVWDDSVKSIMKR